MPFQVLHDRLCTALRGTKPRLVLEVLGPDSTTALVFEDGSRAPAAYHEVASHRRSLAQSTLRTGRCLC
jgi:hypothetical protein